MCEMVVDVRKELEQVANQKRVCNKIASVVEQR